MPTPKKRIASTVYWNSEQEREAALGKAMERDESLSSLTRKLFRKLPHLLHEAD